MQDAFFIEYNMQQKPEFTARPKRYIVDQNYQETLDPKCDT